MLQKVWKQIMLFPLVLDIYLKSNQIFWSRLLINHKNKKRIPIGNYIPYGEKK